MRKCAIISLTAIWAICLIAAGMSYAAGTSKQGAPAQTRAEKKIDINSASKQELMTLPGVGESLAQGIIDGRPYANKQQLRLKKIVPAATYDRIKDMIMAKQAPSKQKSK